jgi:hypothetical protein
MMLDKLKALRALLQPGKQSGDLQLGGLALVACADYCTREDEFGKFAAWAASRPADSPYGWSDPEALRADVEAGKTLVETARQMMPMVMSQIMRRDGQE